MFDIIDIYLFLYANRYPATISNTENKIITSSRWKIYFIKIREKQAGNERTKYLKKLERILVPLAPDSLMFHAEAKT